MTHGAWYSIFLPFRYNDGTLVEDSRFTGVLDTLMERFGGMTEVGEPEGPVLGSWSGFGYTQTERMTIFAVFAEDINSARAFLEEQKLLRKCGPTRQRRDSLGLAPRATFSLAGVQPGLHE